MVEVARTRQEELRHFQRLTLLLQQAEQREANRKMKQQNDDPVRNITDLQSRLMRLRGGGWLQGYDCQAVTSQDGLIIVTGVNNNPADVITYQPMSRAAEQAALLLATQRRGRTTRHHRTQNAQNCSAQGKGLIGVILADTGYLSADNLTAPGPNRLIAVGKSRAVEKAARDNPAEGPPPPQANPIQAMTHRLRTLEGITAFSGASRSWRYPEVVSDEPGVRIGTTERERAQSALGEHLSQGRLVMDEFEERSGLVAAARTSGDLARLFSDLPGGLPAALSTPVPDLTRGHRSSLTTRIRNVGPLLAFMLYAAGLFTGHGWALILLIPAARGLQHR